MLARIGVEDIDGLFADIPEAYRLQRDLEVPPALDEASLMRHMRSLAQGNTVVDASRSFLGAGAYSHHIPPAVDQLLLRGEFYTAYTPYQAEVAQGTLQAMFEFQTLVCELFGLPVANASMYDAASAVAEAALMARRVTGRRRILIAETVHPFAQEALEAYVKGLDNDAPDIVRVRAEPSTGCLDLEALEAALADTRCAAVIVGYPNALGCVEPLKEIAARCASAEALCVSVTYEAYALALLAPPGECGVHIAVGEGQSLACSPNFGGPGVGLFACQAPFLRQLPGRIVGETVDAEGKRGYVLTLSTREQHIRREKATSNICTNHGLVALALTLRTAMLGKRGFRQAGELIAARSAYLQQALAAVPGLSLPYSAATFNEFVVRAETQDASTLLETLGTKGFAGGVALSHPALKALPHTPGDWLVAVTELQPRESLDAFVAATAQAVTARAVA